MAEPDNRHMHLPLDSNVTSQYDALLLVSFGGPEQSADVLPFLQNVTRGRDVPHERLLEVADHYHHFGGRSPINDQNRALIQALEADFSNSGLRLPIYFGNRNWHPLLPDTLAQMRDAGIRRAVAFVTSAFSSYSGCRQYQDDIERARSVVPGAPEIHVLRRFFNHPGFVAANIAHVNHALNRLSAEERALVRLVFTAHSIPTTMAQRCDYELQLRDVAAVIARETRVPAWDLAWQSRSGPAHVPWLEPDILAHLQELHSAGTRVVVIVPVGFTSDHMEVVYDLDHEAKECCAKLGIRMERAATAGIHPEFVSMVRELISERTFGHEPRSVGTLPPRPSPCATGCCPAPSRRPT
jgi:protoporphyrin/coproporphyrin ferrochelatase